LESNNDYKVRNKVIVQAPPAPTVSVPVVTDPVTGEVDVMVPELVQPESPAVVQPVPESVPDSSSPAEAPVE
jgi:hypothetical protein